MAKNLIVHHPQTGQPHVERAVVIGGSIAGLTVAQVLAQHGAKVTVIERDRLPDPPEFRRGAPQALHAHLLLPLGQAILEQHFPGALAELTAGGATIVSSEEEQASSPDGAWYNDVISLMCSRPLLEAVIYRRVAANPKIEIIQEQEVTGLAVDRRAKQVTGIYLRSQPAAQGAQTKLAADLVVDTSGRGSRAPHWLAGLGYTPPRETTVSAFSGYTSRIYRRPANFDESWKMMRIRRIPPNGVRGGMIVPLEGERWQVTLAGMSRDYPPGDEAGFLAFAQSLPSRQLYEAIKEAEPLTKLYSFRGTQNRLRHYEKLPRYLEGFLVCGDAVCTLSPVHAMGMTAALVGSQTLAGCLLEPGRTNIAGLARRFQRQLRQDLNDAWQKVTGSDRSWPASEVAEEIAPAQYPLPRGQIIPVRSPASYSLTYSQR